MIKIKVMDKMNNLIEKIYSSTMLPFLFVLLFSCTFEEELSLSPCVNDNCEYTVNIDKLVNPGYYLDDNGYHHVVFDGKKYFTIETSMSPLKEEHVINGVPLVEVRYDSDKWVVFDSISFSVPVYSYLGYYTGGGLNHPIPIGNMVYTLKNIPFPPLNIVGYSINKDHCFSCPYSESTLGVHNKYSYDSRRMIYINDHLKGDTVNIYMELQWNTDLGVTKVEEHKLKVIIE